MEFFASLGIPEWVFVIVSVVCMISTTADITRGGTSSEDAVDTSGEEALSRVLSREKITPHWYLKEPKVRKISKKKDTEAQVRLCLREMGAEVAKRVSDRYPVIGAGDTRLASQALEDYTAKIMAIVK